MTGLTARRLASLWLPLLAYLALIFALSAQPRLPSVVSAVWDKALHFGAYALLTLIALRAFHLGEGPIRLVPTIVAVMLSVGYGAIDEIHQSFVPGRSSDPLDVLADLAGSVAAAVGVWVLSRWIWPAGPTSSHDRSAIGPPRIGGRRGN